MVWEAPQSIFFLTQSPFTAPLQIEIRGNRPVRCYSDLVMELALFGSFACSQKRRTNQCVRSFDGARAGYIYKYLHGRLHLPSRTAARIEPKIPYYPDLRTTEEANRMKHCFFCGPVPPEGRRTVEHLDP